MTTQSKIVIMQAYEEDREIEYAIVGSDSWYTCVKEPEWNWKGVQYRIKPEPEVTYPIWCKALFTGPSIPGRTLIVKFTSLNIGEVVVSTGMSMYKVGLRSNHWVAHTNCEEWIQVPEPKESIILEEWLLCNDIGKYCVIVLRLFEKEEIKEYCTKNNYTPVQKLREFTVEA